MGMGALNSHAKGKSHQQLVKHFQCLFKTSNNKTSADNQGKNEAITIPTEEGPVSTNKLFTPSSKLQSFHLLQAAKFIIAYRGKGCS